MSSRILVTGAGGNIGKGVIPRLIAAGHQLILSDLAPVADYGVPFHQLDIQAGFGLDRIAEGCDMIVHLPAWHGIHWNQRTEIDFWRLNVDGTFWAFQAARSQGIKRFVFLSSQAWHGHYDKYGFTKRIGEELCEYHRHSNGIEYVAIRPADLTPWRDWANGYGPRLLYGGVDRQDVIESIVRSVSYLESHSESQIVDALRPNAYTEADIADWESDPIAACERIFPGSAELVTKYGLNIQRKPGIVHHLPGGQQIGFVPKVHFGTFIEELRRLDAEGGEAAVRAVTCDY